VPWAALARPQKENGPPGRFSFVYLYAGRLIDYAMTWLEVVLCGLLLVTGGWAVAAQRRYGALQRKHKTLQRLYDKAEQQLNTLWTSKKP